MKEMTLPITSVSSSYSFPDDGRKRVLGTFSPVYSMGSSHQNSELCGTKEKTAMWSPPLAFLPLPQGCPRISMTTYAPGAWGRKWLGLSRSYWGPPHLVVKPPEMVTTAHEDVVLGPDPEESEVQKEAGYAVSDEVTQCTPPLGPSPRRKKPGRN